MTVLLLPPMRSQLLNNFLAAAFLTFAYISHALAQEEDWGIVGVVRTATISFDSHHEDSMVTSFVPMFFYQGEIFYLDGLEAGAKLYETDDVEFFTFTRVRFVDMPRAVQNETGGESGDVGFKAKYPLDESWDLSAELLWDNNAYWHSNFGLSGVQYQGRWTFEPEFTLRVKSDEFNSEYFSLASYTNEKIGSGVDLTAQMGVKYHVGSNFYLLGGAGVTYLDDAAYKSDIIDNRWQAEFYAGIGLFNDNKETSRKQNDMPSYVRMAHGWATHSSMGDILLRFENDKDEYNNQLSSVFYGHPLTDKLLGLDLDIYLHSGVVHHWSSEVQGGGTELVTSFKAYYELNWPVRWRIGVAEGISYIDNITYVEATDMEDKGYTPSHLLNYLDVSYDVNLGSLFNKSDWNNAWFGYSLHHRSAIFESASQFGRIKGGSNYNTVYLQIDL